MQPKIKVCHIITMLELGGAQQNTIYTASHLRNDTFDGYLCYGPGGILTDEANSLMPGKTTFIPHLIREINPYHDTRALIEIYHALKKIKPQIVHTHSSKAGILGRIAAFLAHVPVIIHSIHGFGYTKYQNLLVYHLLKTAEWSVSKITTHFIAVSQANLNQGIQEKLFTPNKVSLIRSGIALDSFKKASPGSVREEFSIQTHQHLITMIACFKPQKSPLDFIKVADQVYQDNKETRFLLVGDGVLRELIETEIKNRNLENIVILTGWRRNIPEIIAASDIIVLTSLWEGLPKTIIEAMAGCKPVVATRVDGTADVIKDGENGFLVVPHDIEAFAQKIRILLENKTLANKFIQASQTLLNEFDSNLMVKKQEELYLKMGEMGGQVLNL